MILSGPGIRIKGSNSLRGFQISGRNVKFTVTTDETWKGKGFNVNIAIGTESTTLIFLTTGKH